MTMRCVTQSRSALAITAMRAAAAGTVDLQSLHRRYDGLVDDEQGAALCARVIDWCDRAVAAPGVKVATRIRVAEQLLKFVSVWHPDEHHTRWRSAVDLLREESARGVSAHVLGDLRVRISYEYSRNPGGIDDGGPVDREAVALVFADAGARHWKREYAHCYLRMLGYFAAHQGPDLSAASVAAVSALVHLRGRNLREKLEEQRRSVAAHPDFRSIAIKIPNALFQVDAGDEFGLLPIVVALVRFLPLPAQEPALSTCMRRWGGRAGGDGPTAFARSTARNADGRQSRLVHDIRNPIAYGLMRVGAIGRHPTVLRPVRRQQGMPVGTVNVLMLQAAAIALTGEPALARDLVAAATKKVRAGNPGAHLHSVHRCATALAGATRGAERQAYALAATLVAMGPLAPRDLPAVRPSG